MNNNDMLFFGILKSSNMDQNMRKELLDLHSRQSELGAKINKQKDIEYKFNQLKIEELNERIDERKFQSEFFIKRNNKILEEINNNYISSFELASRSNQILENLIRSKKNYQNYLNSLLPKILNQFNEQILQNNFLEKELNNIKENEKKSNYYQQLINYNDNIMKEIDILKKKNELLISQNKEKEKILLEKEQQKLNLLIESGVNKEEILKSQNNGSYLDLTPNKPFIKQYVLNANHNLGILDKLKQEKIDIINEQLKKEYNQRNDNTKDLLNDSQNSLDDLRKQIFPPRQFYNPVFGGTLNQNFDDKKIEIKKNIDKSNYFLLNSNIKAQSLKKEEVQEGPKIEEVKNDPKIEEVQKDPKIEEVQESLRKSKESDGSNHDFDNYDIEVIEDNKKKDDEENKNKKEEEELKETQKGEIEDKGSANKDNEEKKEEEMKEANDGEEKKKSKNEEIDDDNGSNHEYDDFEISNA